MPLREFHERLICDECQGMLIDERDLAKACSDLVSRDIELAVSAQTATTSQCPRCERVLASCEIAFTPLAVKADVLRCGRDGVWLRGGQLTSVFALLGRKAHGVLASAASRGPGPIAIDGLPEQRHGAASTGLLISAYRARRRSGPTLTPVNAYRDHHLACPVCTTSELVFFGDRYACQHCAGTFVQNAAFEAMAMDIAMDLFQLPLPTGAAGPRACPVCAQPMLVETIERVPIDRCATHGIWFDANELTVALEHASGQFEQGWRAWLARLFR